MVFPTAAETFAAIDIRMLSELGADVSVLTLRRPAPWPRSVRLGRRSPAETRRAVEGLLAARGLRHIEVNHASLVAVARGIAWAFIHPRMAFDALHWVLSLTWRKPGDLWRSLALLPRSFDILRIVQRRRPDVVHLFWGHYPTLVGHLVRRYAPNSVLSMFLGAYDLRRRFSGSGVVAREADVLWTHTAANVPEIEQLGVPPAHIRVVHRGIDPGALTAVKEERIPRRIVSVGRLIPSKGMDDVLEVFARLLPLLPDATLLILGDGPDATRLRDAARTHAIDHAVGFAGHVDHHRVLRELASAEVFLFLSRTERLPNAVKEAMAAGCVCVVADTVGIEELVVDGETGYVVGVREVDAACERVREILGNPALAARMRNAAIERIKQSFDASKSMAEYLRVWRELLEARGCGQTVTRDAMSGAVP
jgi:glycosyltransferase involved in cell wall biosynthesis